MEHRTRLGVLAVLNGFNQWRQARPTGKRNKGWEDMHTQSTGNAQLGGSARASTDEVQDNIVALRDDISKLAQSVKDLAADQLGTSAAEIQDKAAQKLGDLEAAIRRNPSQSAMIAAGVGLLVGLLLVR